MNMNNLPETNRRPASPEELEEKFRDTPDCELQIMASHWFPEDKTKRLYELTKLSKQQTTSETQKAEIEDLLDQVVTNAMEAATAKYLLKQRK